MPTTAIQLRPMDRSSEQLQDTTGGANAAGLNDSPRQIASHGRETTSPATGTVEESGGMQAVAVVGAATVIFTITLGLVYSFGVSQQLLIERKFATASELGWVSALSVLYQPLLALPLQMAVLRYGNRTIALIGTVLASGGFISTSFCFQHSLSSDVSSAQRLAPLFIAQSVFGMGYACMFWASNTIAVQWVSPRRMGIATGICYSGSGVGGAIFSVSLSKLAARIGLENSLRIYGAIAFVLLLPSSCWLKTRHTRQERKLTMHWSLAKDRKFAFLFVATLLLTFSLYVPPFFLPTYAASAGFSSDVGAWLVAGEQFRTRMLIESQAELNCLGQATISVLPSGVSCSASQPIACWDR